MRFPDQGHFLLHMVPVGLIMALLSSSAQAQGPAPGSSMSRDGLGSGAPFAAENWSLAGSSSTYLPFGGMGGFVPYTTGPGQGLGVMSRTGQAAPGTARERMGMIGATPSLGQIRGNITAPAPLGGAGNGMGRTGMSGTLIRRTPSGGRMDSMRRPPVGSYPFRIPPSLLGPGTASPAMSM